MITATRRVVVLLRRIVLYFQSSFHRLNSFIYSYIALGVHIIYLGTILYKYIIIILGEYNNYDYEMLRHAVSFKRGIMRLRVDKIEPDVFSR